MYHVLLLDGNISIYNADQVQHFMDGDVVTYETNFFADECAASGRKISAQRDGLSGVR